MPALHVRDVPDVVLIAIKERAQRHHRSVQQEVRAILQAAAEQPREPVQLPPLHLHMVPSGAPGPTTSTWSREELYGDDGR